MLYVYIYVQRSVYKMAKMRAKMDHQDLFVDFIYTCDKMVVGSGIQRGVTVQPSTTTIMCARTAQNKFARDLVGKPCRPVPLIATHGDARTRFAEIVSRRTKSD